MSTPHWPFRRRVSGVVAFLLWTVARVCAADDPKSDPSALPLGLAAPNATHADSIDAAASNSPAHWLETYRQRLRVTPADCAPVSIPSLRQGVPSLAFSLAAAADNVGPVARIVYAEDTVGDRLIVLAEDDRGCIHVGESGRLLPFTARAILSPLPNSEIPAALGLTPPVAILEDAKTLRPWIGVLPVSAFQERSAWLWVLLGGYTGVLSMLLLVGIGVALWQRNRLAWAYVVYVATFQFYQLQSFGVGPAWLPFWPGPEHAYLMQALSLALLVTGIGTIVTAFIQPRGWPRTLLFLVLTLSAVAPVVALWLPLAYRIGGVVTIVMIVVVLALLVQRLRDGEAATRWFALGIAAMMIGGGIRSIAVAGQGADMGGIVNFAFPVGNLIESVCWLIALSLRFNSERAAMLKQLRHDAIHEPLTGLHNRAYLRGEIQTALDLVRVDPTRRFGLLFLDLDGFKSINDSLGHATGDRVLIEVAETLVGLDLNTRTIGRFGGDEFLLLMAHDTHWSVTLGCASTDCGALQGTAAGRRAGRAGAGKHRRRRN